MIRIRFERLQEDRARLLKWVFWIGVTLLLILVPRTVAAGTIKLAWDPVPDTDLAGYHVYYGTSSGAYTASLSVGKQTTATLSNLQDCQVYFVAVKAVDSNGNESASYSNEISGMSAPVPASVSGAPLLCLGGDKSGQACSSDSDCAVPSPGTSGTCTGAAAKQGSANLNLVVAGTNFDTQAIPDFGPDITVNSYSTPSCNQLLANVSIGETARVNSAPALPRLLSVVNQGGPVGQTSGAFTVLFDEHRADIDHSGKVMARDLLIWSSAFGTAAGDPGYNIDADLNGDGVVDGADLTLLAIWHGTTFF